MPLMEIHTMTPQQKRNLGKLLGVSKALRSKYADMTPSMMGVLSVLGVHGELPSTEISRKAGISESQGSKFLTRTLPGLGLVEIADSPDFKSRIYRLTRAGEKFLEELSDLI